MRDRTRIPTPISTFAEYCAEDDERKQWNLVRDVKYRSGGGGVGPIMRFRQIASTARHQGQDIATVEYELKALMARASKVSEKERLELLSNAFIGQWRKYDYRFQPVQGTNVSLARLTIKVFPDLGVVTRAGGEIAVRLWLSERNIMDKERDTFIYLMSEAKKPAQWPANWSLGVWELEQGHIHHVIAVSDALRNLVYERAEMFAEMWDTLPSKQDPPLPSVPVGQRALV